MSNCSICNNNPGEFICIQPKCVKINGNQMLCYLCYWKQHKEHPPKKIQDVCSKATENKNKQIQILKQMINKNNQELIQLEQFLENQKEIYIVWNNQQKKLVKQFTETQNYKLQQQIKETEQILQEQNLDSMLNYCLINLNQQEEQYQKACEQSNQERKFQINEIQTRINIITDLQFSISDLSHFFIDIPNASIPQPQDQSSIKQNKCQYHQKPLKYLCIHKECTSQNCSLLFFCKKCFINIHKQHDFKTYGKKYKFIKSEQDEKTQLINNEQEKIKTCIQQQFNKNYELIQKEFYDKMQKYEQIKSNMLKIKEQSMDHLNKLFTFEFKENNININLLNKTTQEIQQQYSIEYKSFQQKISSDFLIEENKILTFTSELDKINEKEQKDISILHQEIKSKNEQIDKLKSELQINEQLNSKYQNLFSQLYILQNSHKSVQQSIDELIKKIKEKWNGSTYLSISDRQFLQTFDNNCKDIKTQINAIQDQIENIINECCQFQNNQVNQKYPESIFNRVTTQAPKMGLNNGAQQKQQQQQQQQQLPQRPKYIQKID